LDKIIIWGNNPGQKTHLKETGSHNGKKALIFPHEFSGWKGKKNEVLNLTWRSQGSLIAVIDHVDIPMKGTFEEGLPLSKKFGGVTKGKMESK